MFLAGRRDFIFGLLLLYQAPRGLGFEPVLTESGYVHRSEDVCYRVQLSLHLLSKAIVFCEDCTKLQVEEASTMTDILLPSSVTTPTLLSLEPRVPAPSKKCKTARFSPLSGRIDKNLGLLSSFRPPPKNLP